MAAIFYHASQEQFPPSYLLSLAKLAEQAGFNGIHSSEHFFPWSIRQGHSGFTFSWIAAAMQATSLPYSMVCAPGGRYHPAVVAQAIGTLGEMFPGRFHIELGSGEALNESITGTPWPDKETRNKRLLESAEAIRKLLNGEEVSCNGEVIIKEAKLYTLPIEPPPLYCAAISEETARWAGQWSDGLLTTAGDLAEIQKKVNTYKENGGQSKPVSLQLAFSYARSKEEAIMGAWDQWRSNLVSSDQLANLSKPEHFDERSHDISPETVSSQIPIYTSIEELTQKIKELETIDPSTIILHNVNRLQEEFIEDWGRMR